VFDQELGYIFETLRRLGARPSEIEDLVQEIFVVLHRNWPILDTTRSLRPYIFGIAYRMVYANRRRWAREAPCAGLDKEDDAPMPERAMQSQEARALLFAALERVPLPRRAVIVMHDLEGVPIHEIAQRLSLSEFGTYSRLRKGRKELAAAARALLKQGTF